MEDYSYFYEMLKKEKIIEGEECQFQLTKSFMGILTSNIKKYSRSSEVVRFTIIAFCPTMSAVQLLGMTATLLGIMERTQSKFARAIEKEREEAVKKNPEKFKNTSFSTVKLVDVCKEVENLK